MEVGAQKESQEELPGTKNKRKQRKQHMEEIKTNRNKTTKKDTGGGTNNIVRVFGENVTGRRPAPVQVFWGVLGCSGVFWGVLGCSGVFGCFGVFLVNDILEGQKGDQGGGPKMAKIQYGVKPDVIKRAAQKRPKFNMW